MKKDAATTLIVGGNGKTGRRVAERLRQRGLPFRLASRTSKVPFDWNDDSTWDRAVADAASLYVTYAPDLALPGAASQVHRLSRLAVKRGVRRIVLLAGRGDAQVEEAKQAVRESRASYTIVECAFFAQNFSEGFTAPVDNEIAFPAGQVAEPFIHCDDIADVVVAALTNDVHSGKTYELTGPRLLTFEQAASELASASGSPIRYVPISFEQYALMLAPHFPAREVALFTELFRGLLDGHNAHTTDDVERVLGRKATDFSVHAREAVYSLQHAGANNQPQPVKEMLMPYINVQLTKGATRAEKSKIVQKMTEALVSTLGKNPEHIHIVIQEIAEQDWGFAGKLTDDWRQEQVLETNED